MAAVAAPILDPRAVWVRSSMTRAKIRVIYLGAIKKVVGYAHTTKKFSDTCMP
jgi:hypothetical protein